MRPGQVHRLSSQHVNVTRSRASHGVVRQMHVKRKSRYAGEITALVQVWINRERTYLVGPLYGSRAQAVASFNRDSESFHQGANVNAKALLTGHERIAVMMVLDVSHFQVVGSSDVVM